MEHVVVLVVQHLGRDEGATCREGTTLGKDMYVKAGSGRPRARGYPRARGASISFIQFSASCFLPRTLLRAESALQSIVRCAFGAHYEQLRCNKLNAGVVNNVPRHLCTLRSSYIRLSGIKLLLEYYEYGQYDNNRLRVTRG